MENRYFLLETSGCISIDLADATLAFARGKDYYVDILRAVAAEGGIRGLTFFISETSPELLPKYGKDVVLILLSDEAYKCRHYWVDIRAVIRTYDVWPAYLDGWPTTRLRATALLNYIYKSLNFGLSVARASVERRDLKLLQMREKVLHAPLGTFFRFEPTIRRSDKRPMDFVFLGSVGYNADHQRLRHRLFTPPKILSRALMLKALETFAERVRGSGTIRTTTDFEESIKNQANYVRALEGSKISVCPRGSNPETYRFFESCKAGCVVVCEPLPATWFYDGHPAVVVRDWRELPAVLERLLRDPGALQDLADQTRKYWESRLSEHAVANRIRKFLIDSGNGYTLH